jgi:RNA polymerase primary sigma factor
MSMRRLKISKSITNRESMSFIKYLQEISKVEPLQPDEEVELAVRIRNGDCKALDRLTRANLRFVVSVSKKYQGQGVSLSDLINEGNLGLVKAAQRYDETKGFKFISYAVWWIRQSMLQAIAEQSRLVRIPMNRVGITNRVSQAFQSLEQEFEREPTAEELAEVLDLEIEEVTHSLRDSVRHVSVDSPIADEEEDTLVDILENKNASHSDEKLVHEESLKMDIETTLQVLTEKQKNVLCYFYGIGVDYPLTLEGIGERFSITRERARQIREQALTKLRSESSTNRLRFYLG